MQSAMRALMEALRQRLAKKGNRRFDETARAPAERMQARLALKDCLFEQLDVHRRTRADDVRFVKVAVRGDHHLFGKAGRRLEAVNVLREAALELPMGMQLAQEAVRARGRVLAWPHLAAEPVKGARIGLEEVDVEDLRRGAIEGHPMSSEAIRWQSEGNPMAIRWQSDGNPMAIRGNQMAIRWQSDGNQMALRWQSDGHQRTASGNGRL